MMYRISSCVCKARLFLYHRKPIEMPLAALSRCSVMNQYKKWQDPEREPCPKIERPPPPPKDDAMFWGAVALLAITGGFTVYAKRNPEVRDWLSMHAPWFDEFIAVAYQENMTYLEFGICCVEEIKKRMVALIEPPKECSNEIEIIIEKDDLLTDEDSPCDALPPPIVTKDICEVEACMKDLGDSVINNYITARDACTYYNKLVRETMSNFTFTGMKKLRKEMEERRELVVQSLKNAQECNAQLDDLTRYLECGVSTQKDKVEKTREMLHEYRTNIKKLDIEFKWENDLATALDAQWTQLETIIDSYTDENQSMYSMLNYEDEKPFIHGDLDFLLHHTRRYINKLDANLMAAMPVMTNRIDRGLEILPQGVNENKQRNNKIAALFKKRKAELDSEYTTKLSQLKQKNDKATKDALKMQLKQHEESVAQKLREREAEVIKSFNKMVSDKVEPQKKLFAVQLSNMKQKLNIVESRLNKRLKADRETKRSQDLWSAGASLLAATKKGEPYIPVSKELRAIERASGDGDKLVLTVLNSIPQSVWDQGVVPESVLREKYHSMEKVALSVALVEHDGAPLPVYFMSWLQSAFLFMKLSSIPQTELDNPPKEPYNFEHFDTFDLLQRARYFIERGNIAAALRYVSALEGASRSAANTWYEAARAHLETRQAAEAVIAHAAALGLQYI